MPLSKQIDLSVVIPVHNETASVDQLISEVAEAFADPFLADRQCELILVDDGSTDDTSDRCHAKIAQLSFPASVISLRRNHGQTAAMQIGFEHARGQLIASLDGDLQNDPADIPRMVEHLERHDLDLLCGRRKNRQDHLLSRKLPSWIANRLIGRVTGIRISDYGCSLKVYRGELIRQIHLVGEMHRFIPAWLSKLTSPQRISEIDVNHRARKHGATHYGISRTLRVMLDLMSVIFFIRFKNRPGHFFGSIGIAMMAVGTTMLALVMGAKFGLGQDIGDRPMLMIGAFAFFSGIQMVSIGIVAELVARIYLQTPQAIRPLVLRATTNEPAIHSIETTRFGKAA